MNFTLNKFRMQVMKLCLEEFKECYGIDKNCIGKRCKLYIRTSLNSHNWLSINHTIQFHELLITEYKTKKRNKSWLLDRIFKVHISIGKAKSGEAFINEDDAESYFDLSIGEASDFSPKDAQSPRVKLNSSQMNMLVRSLPVQAKKMLLKMYTNETSKLYHGFLWDHLDQMVAVLIRMSNVNLTSNGASEIRSLLQSENEDSILSNTIVDNILLDLRIQLSSSAGSEFPCKGKFPPLVEGEQPPKPPTLVQWKHHQHPTRSGQNNFNDNPLASVFSSIFNSVLLPKESREVVAKESREEIVNVTFSYAHDFHSVAVMDDLTISSTMLEILKETCIFELLLGGADGCVFKLEHESGFYKYPGAKFCKMKVGSLLRMQLVKIPLQIVIE